MTRPPLIRGMAHLHCILFNGGLSFPSVKSYPVCVVVGSITAGQVIARVPLRNLVAFAISYGKAEGFTVCRRVTSLVRDVTLLILSPYRWYAMHGLL